MSDQYDRLRSLSLETVCKALEIPFEFKKSGKDWRGKCPIHKSKDNDTCFRYHRETGVFHCFSCKAKGHGAIDLVMKVKSIKVQAAVELLQPYADTAPPKEKSPMQEPAGATEGVDDELKPYKGSYEKFKVSCPWLDARVPDKAIQERYGVFCYNNPARKSAYSGRVMIPFKNPASDLFGYLGRGIQPEDDQPKYLIPAGFPKAKFLFGADVIQAGMFGPVPLRRACYLVESPFCVMKFASMGFPAVSPFGWSVSAEQYSILQTLAKGIVYLPDRNKHDDCATTIHQLSCRLWVHAPELPDSIDDPEQLQRQQVLDLTH